MSTQEDLQKVTLRLYKRLKRASEEHHLIQPHDHILVCMSGGKDSYTMLRLLIDLQQRTPFPFKLTAYHLDQRQPGYPEGVIDAYLAEQGIPYVVQHQDTYSVVTEKLAPGATPCSLCSRLRRGIIYDQAEALGCNKIALGHHRDDSIETLLLNMIYTGQLQGMPAAYTTDDKRFQVIRPLIYCAEDDIARYAALQGFPIIPCNLCGSVEKQRKWVKSLITQIEDTAPGARHSMLAAMQHVRTTHLLDRGLLDRLDGATRGDEDDDLEDILMRPKPSITSAAEDLLF
jgi:tRNA 2-thiocytidine biosynthesis protein TtcA